MRECEMPIAAATRYPNGGEAFARPWPSGAATIAENCPGSEHITADVKVNVVAFR